MTAVISYGRGSVNFTNISAVMLNKPYPLIRIKNTDSNKQNTF